MARAPGLVLLTIGLAPLCYGQGDLAVSAPRPGRVFFAGEPVVLSLKAAQATGPVQYTVTDYWGKKIAAGAVRLAAGRAQELRLAPLTYGWYRLDFAFPDGTHSQDCFCVLRPMRDEGRHFRRFGVCALLNSQALADFLSFAGLRALRRDWGWPTIQPAPGQWNPQPANQLMQRAAAAGLELIPILGYTPGFAGAKPLDALSDRPAYATHTWPVLDLQKWVQYLQWCKAFARQWPTVRWPPARLAPTEPPRPAVSPIHAWEIWNEADQNFFYGPWHNYCDLLRLAYAVLDDLRTPVIYGGSCGHWTETGMAYAWRLRSFFDWAAGHPGHEVDESMAGWFYGAYAIGYKYGAPHSLCFTETYFCDDATSVSWPQYVLPMFGKLAHWGIEEQYRFVEWQPSLELNLDTDALCYWRGPEFAATPAYVALAFARWLLADAAYVGRLTLGQKTQAYVWLRAGRPLLVLCSGQATPLSVLTDGKAQVYNFLGATLPAGTGPRLTLLVGQAPLAIEGAAWTYLADAAKARLAEFLDTQYGVRPPSSKWCPYLSTVREDICAFGAAQLAAAEAAASAAFDTLGAQGPVASAPLFAQATDALRALIIVLARRAAGDETDGALYNALWRILAVAEWLSEIADEVACAAGDGPAGEAELLAARTYVLRSWPFAVSPTTGLERVRARSLCRRAWRTLDLAQASRGKSMCLLAITQAQAARRWAATEPPVLNRLVAVAQFPTAAFLVKAQLLEPAQPHRVRLLLCNQTSQTVEATVRVRFPPGWQPEQASLQATVPARTMASVGEVQVQIPAEGSWVAKSSWRPGPPLVLLCPERQAPEQQVEVWAEVQGRKCEPSYYFFNMGRWPPSNG
jgi:hypothetical protein